MRRSRSSICCSELGGDRVVSFFDHQLVEHLGVGEREARSSSIEMSSFRPPSSVVTARALIGVVPKIRTRDLVGELVPPLAQALETQIRLSLGQPRPKICELGLGVARRLSARHQRLVRTVSGVWLAGTETSAHRGPSSRPCFR